MCLPISVNQFGILPSSVNVLCHCSCVQPLSISGEECPQEYLVYRVRDKLQVHYYSDNMQPSMGNVPSFGVDHPQHIKRHQPPAIGCFLERILPSHVSE